MSYKVTFTTTINDINMINPGPAHAIETARLAVQNYGSSGYPEVLAEVEYTRTIKEGWALKFNPGRVTVEKNKTTQNPKT